MIKIKRCDCPISLNKPDINIVKSDYSRDDVIDALYNMQHSKCCYCEKDLSELGRTSKHVEHYIPSSSLKNDSGTIDWGLANTWDNLLYACSDCNSKKRSKNPANDNLDQYIIIYPACDEHDPEDEISFIIDGFNIIYVHKNGSISGLSTINSLQFNQRKEIRRSLRRTKSKIGSTFSDLYSAIEDNNLSQINSLQSQLRKMMSADSPCSAFCRNYIKQILEQFNDKAIPKLSHDLDREIDNLDIVFLKGFETV